ncbi:MAG: hypothetical protein IPL26_12915 [Leptospiraceae bacterium]|nr:hypothetical protein [Leptospiraceae bacterium]
MNNVQSMYSQLSEYDQWFLIITLWCTVIVFIYAALNVPSEDILKANKEKRRLEKLNGVRK